MATPNDPPITFSTFLISLASSGLAHLRQVDDPVLSQAKPDLHLARQTLDLLGILAEKTKGNLETDEAKLLDAVRQELAHKVEEAARRSG